MEQRGKESEDGNMEHMVRDRWKMEDENEGDKGQKVDKGQRTEDGVTKVGNGIRNME